MKTLLLLRHAKSSWEEPGLPDHDRPLNKRGKNTAPRMGDLILENDLIPDLILCSSAKRARKTAVMAMEKMGFVEPFQIESDLYHAVPESIVQVIREAQLENVARLLVIGHNPGQEDLILALTREQEAFPTGALAEIELPLDKWNDLDLTTTGNLMNLWRPKEL